MQFKQRDFRHAFYMKVMNIPLYSNACGIAVKWHTAGGPLSFAESLSELQLQLLMFLIGILYCCNFACLSTAFYFGANWSFIVNSYFVCQVSERVKDNH